MENENIVNLKNTKQIDLPQFNPSEYMGKQLGIDEVTEHKGKVYDGRQSYYVMFKVLVDPSCDQLGGEPLFATRLVGLQSIKDSDGKEVIGWGEDTKMGKFLKQHGVNHYNEMKGVKVMITKQLESNFLTF